jgi:glycerol-3-phosphate dehydrogenase
MRREESLQHLHNRTTPWDIVVIGGGATGVAIALDAASRGLQTLLVERCDFGKGTSSRSTKLVHGGVRYLEQGNLTLVRDALHERTLLRSNAPLLVHDLPFFIPCATLAQQYYFWAGLKLYDFLAGKSGFERSRRVSAAAAAERLPTLRRQMHQGGVIYHDGQFDDCRLLIHMVRTAVEQGGCLLNYIAATGLVKDASGRISGVQLIDVESEQSLIANARCVINAGGPFSDDITRMDDPATEARLAASQGVHLVLPHEFFPGQTALIVPRTSDGRVLFVIPWRDHVVVGTTDTPIAAAVAEPMPQPQEIQFLLQTAAQYLTRAPLASDVTSVFTGVRPLVKNDRSTRTASLSRDHSISVSPSGLVTIRGGKWTTVRKMAEDCVDRALESANLPACPCRTESMPLHLPRKPAAAGGVTEPVRSARGAGSPGGMERAGVFDSPDQPAIEQLISADPALARSLGGLPEMRAVDVIWSVRHEMARTVEDVLARRTRWLFLDVRRSLAVAPEVAQLMAAELGRDEAWQRQQLDELQSVAKHFDIDHILAKAH